ncbi:hypothetical protein [Billgrantia saliphila]|nr:hypothetical protein [Halomonas saliphila]
MAQAGRAVGGLALFAGLLVSLGLAAYSGSLFGLAVALAAWLLRARRQA